MYKKKSQKYFTTVQKYFTQHHGVEALEQEEGVFLKENSFKKY